MRPGTTGPKDPMQMGRAQPDVRRMRNPDGIGRVAVRIGGPPTCLGGTSVPPNSGRPPLPSLPHPGNADRHSLRAGGGTVMQDRPIVVGVDGTATALRA